MRYLLIIILVSFSIKSSATAQYPDYLLYKGRNYSLLTNPASGYLSENLEHWVKIRERYQNFYENGEEIFILPSTAMQRGYIAYFEVADDKLFLNNIEIPTAPDHDMKSITAELFLSADPVHVEWYTGYLILSYGELVRYEHLDYASTYSDYIIMKVKKGIVINETPLNYTGYEDFRQKQFEKYKSTDEYKEKTENAYNPEMRNEYLYKMVSLYISKMYD